MTSRKTAPVRAPTASGDRLQVVVFRHPDLSGQFSLDGEGYVALPLAGEIAAGDLTTRQLEDEIETRLKGGGFLISPQVSVQLVTYRSFYVLRSAPPAATSIEMASRSSPPSPLRAAIPSTPIDRA